jgi:hypothetical protein
MRVEQLPHWRKTFTGADRFGFLIFWRWGIIIAEPLGFATLSLPGLSTG